MWLIVEAIESTDYDLRKYVCFLYIVFSILNRSVRASLQLRSMRGRQKIKCPWISSSRGRRESSLQYQELLPLVVPRSSPCSHLFALSCSLSSLRHLMLYFSCCFQTHLPGFVEQAEDLKSKGIQEVACISVNDAFVMAEWGKAQGTDGKVWTSLFFLSVMGNFCDNLHQATCWAHIFMFRE